MRIHAGFNRPASERQVRDVLDDRNVDACLLPRPPLARSDRIAAMQAGKDVYIESRFRMSIVKALIIAAAEIWTVVQQGSQMRSSP